MRRSLWVGCAVAVAMVLGITPAAAQPPTSGKRLVLNDVHTDTIDVRYEDGQLRLQTRIGQQPYEFAAADEVIFQLKDVPESALQVPDDPAFAFLGAPGDPIWVAPQTQDPALLFAGWDTEGIPAGVLAGDVVRLELVSAAGPGKVEIFQLGEFGDVLRIFSGTDPAHRALAVPVSSHAHANWSFGALGRYELTFRARAQVAGGDEVVSAPTTYTWYVGDVVPLGSAVALAASVAEAVTLTATVQPGHAAGWVAFREGARELGFAQVEGGTATLTTTALEPGEHRITAHFIPRYDNDFTPSASDPVAVVVTGPPPPPSSSPSASPSAPPSASPSGPPSSPAKSPSVPACVPGTTYLPVLDHEHVDIATRLVNGRLDMAVKDSVWRDPAGVVLHLKPGAAMNLPPSGFDFLGAPGSTVWQIPQTQRAGILWLGWNTEAMGAPVTWSLTKVNGPGRVAVYEYTAFGQPRIIFNSGDGLPDRYEIDAGTHAHGNWAFTRQGVYKLTFRQQSGSTTDTATVTIVVGDIDPRPHAKGTSGCGGLPRTGDSIASLAVAGGGLLLAGGALAGLAMWRRRKAAA